MKRCVILLALALTTGSPSMAQELPKPTPAGEKSLQDLVERCVTACGLKRTEDAKTHASTLAPGDGAKLKDAVEQARSTLNPPMFDALITQCREAKGDHESALVALLRVSGEVADNGRAGAFATWFEALRRGKADESIALLEDAARRFQLCEDRVWQAACYHRIGNVLYGSGAFAKALETFQKALEIRRAVLGDRHPDIAASYNNIAIVYQAQGEHARTLEMFIKALEINRAVLGDRHPDVATSYRIDNTDDLRAWVLELAGQIRVARAAVAQPIPVSPAKGQCRPCGMRGHCGQARI